MDSVCDYTKLIPTIKNEQIKMQRVFVENRLRNLSGFVSRWQNVA